MLVYQRVNDPKKAAVQDLASSPCPNPGPARVTGRCQGRPSEGAALGFLWDSPSFFHHERNVGWRNFME